jgi:hypothetical protein
MSEMEEVASIVTDDSTMPVRLSSWSVEGSGDNAWLQVELVGKTGEFVHTVQWEFRYFGEFGPAAMADLIYHGLIEDYRYMDLPS